MKLSSWFKFMNETEKENYDGDNKEKYYNELDKIFKLEVEDRDIVLEDLKKNEGLLYKKMVEWNENKVVIEEDLNMVWWEYSLEDYFRDMFNNEDGINEEFSLFSYKEINKVLY